MDWTKEINIAVTVCDEKGIITYMNDKAVKTFENDGGEKLIGTNILDCHSEPSKTQLKGLMEKQETNSYTIEKNGVKKLIYQAPWFEKGIYKGIYELSLEIPAEMSHFVRK